MPENKSQTYFYYQVIPKTPVFKSFTYKSLLKLARGQRVKIPFGRRKINGFIWREEKAPAVEEQKIKEILEWDQNSAVLGEERLNWLNWLSSYYHYPLGPIIDLSFLQASFKKRKDNSSLKIESAVTVQEDKMLKLNTEQQNCVNEILQQSDFQVHLIHGITGSGKTEVYIRLIAHTLKRNKQALVLLPEIFLTPQIVKRLETVFVNQVALLHSQVSQSQKTKVWKGLLSGQKKLLIGTRSALFCPLPHLGLIIVDEEHDSSFKQEGKFRYHARDSAIVLAKTLNIPIVLGSATPDFSSYKNALDSSYKLYELKQRAFKQTLPKVTIVDLKNKAEKSPYFWLSDLLLEKITNVLDQGKQVALFVNRRGQATSLLCATCGQTQKCLNCDISLTLHRKDYLVCHYCSFLQKKPLRCSSCQSDHWIEKGFGTQKVEEEMKKLFPQFKTLRVDRDSIPSQEEMKNFIDQVESHQAQIIIGTQMLSKGLNFPSIYLVGLILADMDFHFPDFRAEERSFQTLLQMAGRAGRTGFGEVILQTFNPQHSSILFAKRHDYKGFFLNGIKSREVWSYPPFSRLCLLRIDSLKEKEGLDFARQIADQAKQLALPFQKRSSLKYGIQILGPSPAPLGKIKNRYRWQVLVKGENHVLLDQFLKKLFLDIPKKSFIQLKIDRDPSSMF